MKLGEGVPSRGVAGRGMHAGGGFWCGGSVAPSGRPAKCRGGSRTGPRGGGFCRVRQRKTAALFGENSGGEQGGGGGGPIEGRCLDLVRGRQRGAGLPGWPAEWCGVV